MDALSVLAPRRIGVVRFGRIGDMLLLTPTLRALRQRFPAARIEVATHAACVPVLKRSPDIDIIHPVAGWFATARALRGVDLVVDAQRTDASALAAWASGAPVRLGWRTSRWHDALLSHVVDPQRSYSAHFQASVLRSVGVGEVDLDLALDPGDSARAAAEAAFPGEARRIALAPGASVVTRTWPEARWVALAQALGARGWEVIVVWGPGEQPLAQRVAAGSGARLAGPTSILELAATIARCRVFVGNCSGPRHIAVSQRVPTLVMHGATAVGAWTRPSAWHRALWTDEPCRPCNQPRCPIAVRCLTRVEVEPAVAIVEALALLGPEPPLRVRIRP